MTPLAGGGTRTGRSVVSGSSAVIGTGIASVIHTSWKAAVPMSRVLGFGPSESTTDLPEASWPVTIRRGGVGAVDMGRNPMSAPGLGLGALDRHARQRPVELARQPPVAVAEQVHDRGHEHGAQDERVEQDGAREADPELGDDTL